MLIDKFNEDRASWAEERKKLEDTIDTLRELRAFDARIIKELREKLSELEQTLLDQKAM